MSAPFRRRSPTGGRPVVEARRPTRRPSPRGDQLLFRAIQLVLVVVAISRYDATSYIFRGEEAVDFFNWFWRRRWFGVLSFFEFALLGLIGIALLVIAFRRRQLARRFDGFALLITALVAASLLVRYVTQGPADTRQDLLFQLRNYVYLVLTYLLARRIEWDESRFRSMMGLVLGLGAVVILLYFFETRVLPQGFWVGKFGRYATVRDVSDFAFILFGQFWLIALALERFPARWPHRIALLSLIAYVLYSTFTGIGKTALFVYPAYLAYFFFHYRLYRRPVFVALLGLGVLALAGLVAYMARVGPPVEPTSPLYVYTTFRSDDLSVSTRSVEFANFLENLGRRGAWLQGLGLGSKWFEYRDQPPDAAAFPAQERGTPWHLGVHVPLLRLGYDFGLIGLVILLAFFAGRFVAAERFLGRSVLRPSTRAFVQAAFVAIGYELFVHNLGVPKTNLLVGVLLGSVRGLTESGVHLRVVARANRAPTIRIPSVGTALAKSPGRAPS